ncbi:MAG: prepilin peptidase [Steroidobacteraceae bacterium]|jgi:leader peptidase (prepilin peptidase) / N-methyltransferase
MSVIELLAASPAMFVGTCLVLGLAVGSFLNVVIYRLPVMLDRQWREQCAEFGAAPAAATPAAAQAPFNLVVPRSACPTCKAPITALENIPVISWLVLRGRCAHCGARISLRYPLVEALTGILSAWVAIRFGFGLPAVAALTLTWFLIALAGIDIDHQLLPDSLTLPLLWLGLTLSLWGPQGASPVPVDVRSSLIGAAAGYASLWSVYHLFRLLTGKEGMGYGDFKLFAALGAWLGWQMLLPVILIAAVVGAVVGLVLLGMRAHSRATPIAFGPFLAAAGWLVLMFGHEIVGRYLGLFPPHP